MIPAGMKPHGETGQRALEVEFLGKLAATGKPIKLPDLFEGMSPHWAVTAAERVTRKGWVTRTQEGKYELTAAGKEHLAASLVSGKEVGVKGRK